MTIRDDKPSFGPHDTMIQLGEDPGEDNRTCQALILHRRIVLADPPRAPYPLFDLEISVGTGEHRDDSVTILHGLHGAELKRLGQHLIALSEVRIPEQP